MSALPCSELNSLQWMDLEGTIPSEKNQTEKDKYSESHFYVESKHKVIHRK